MISSQQQRMGVEVRRACQSGGRVWYKGPEAEEAWSILGARASLTRTFKVR